MGTLSVQGKSAAAAATALKRTDGALTVDHPATLTRTKKSTRRVLRAKFGFVDFLNCNSFYQIYWKSTSKRSVSSTNRLKNNTILLIDV